MTSRRELGNISKNEGVVTCLEFYKDTHLFCGTETGKILVWSAPHWHNLPTMTGHYDRVNSISVHPSGVLALSVSKDKSLRLWDLSKGVAAHTNKLDQEAFFVKWSPKGDYYLVVYETRITVYAATGAKLNSFNEKKRILAVTWLDDEHYMIGGENRMVSIYHTRDQEPCNNITGFGNRVKGISTMAKTNKKDQKYPYVVTISSDERIRVFDPDQSFDTPVCSVYQDVRFICLAVAPVPQSDEEPELKTEKSKKKQNTERHDEAPVAAAPASKKFKIIEYEEHKPIRKQGSSKPHAKNATPLKSILKSSKPAQETDATSSTETQAHSEERRPKHSKGHHHVATAKSYAEKKKERNDKLLALFNKSK